MGEHGVPQGGAGAFLPGPREVDFAFMDRILMQFWLGVTREEGDFDEGGHFVGRAWQRAGGSGITNGGF
jgi:hypothetical protein